MILSSLKDASRYENFHPLFPRALEFLRSDSLAALPDGKHEIDGENLFAVVWRGIGKGQADAILECHRRYIDIQYVVSGIDQLGWLPTDACRREKQAFDEQNDLQFFLDRPSAWITVPSGSFTILYPEDAHAPLATTGPVHKVVLKILCDA